MKSIVLIDLAKKKINELSPRSARDLMVTEKTIEDLMARNPGLVFTRPEAVLVIGQEVAGEPMADLLAADSQGTLIVIEAKRGSSDRNTVGQLLDYAAKLSNWDYGAFSKLWQRNPASKNRDLFDAFKEFSYNSAFPKEDFLKDRRFFILASTGDDDMKRIIEWLQKYKVPIDFVPFQFYAQGKQHFLEIEKIDVDAVKAVRGWKGDWLFNTNERYAPGSYKKMLKNGVIALANYTNTEEKLNKPSPGNRIFAYLNGKGVIAVGRMGPELAYPSHLMFKEEDEYNRKVDWEIEVETDKGVTSAQIREWGYNLPTLTVLGKMANAKVAEKIAEELEKRRERDD